MTESESLEEENTRLRAALAQSESPCVYCSLPKDEWAKCQSGFPNCSRADDAMGCPYLGASMEVEQLKEEIERLKDFLRDIGAIIDDWQAGPR